MKKLILLLALSTQAFAAPSSSRTLRAQFLKNGTGVLTLPSSSDTLVGKATTDVFTNKTFDVGGVGNVLSNIVDSNLSASAAVSFSKLHSLTSAHTLIGSAGNVATDTAVTGDISLSNAGVTAYSGTVPINKGGTGQTTANTSLNALLPSQTSNNLKVLKTDGTNTSWAAAATGGGSKNYLGTINGTDNGGDFEGNTSGNWVLGHAALTSALPTGSPTFGSGAAGGLSTSIVSGGSAISGSYSLNYGMVGVTIVGDFLASPAYTIDLSDRARVMTFKFNYTPTVGAAVANWSGTSSNSFGVAIYDVTNSAWIIPAGVFSMNQSSGIGYATGTFQTSATGTSYRFVMYHANATSGGNFGMTFDDFFLGPQTAPMGPAMTDWVAFTPAQGTWLTSANAVYTGFWRRVGDRMEVVEQVAVSGAPTSASLTMKIPTGYTIDTSKMTSFSESLGTAVANDSGATTYTGGVIYSNTTTVQPVIFNAASTIAVDTAITQAAPFTFGAGDAVIIRFTIPIVGWSSNVLMSQDTDTRVVAFRATNVAGTSIANSGDVKVPFATADYDTHGAFATDTYTVPVSGKYRVTGVINFATSVYAVADIIQASVYKNGTIQARAPAVAASTTTSTFLGSTVSTVVNCVAGDTLDIRINNTRTAGATLLATGAGANHMEVERLSGPAVVAISESVNMKYANTAGTSIANSGATNVPFATKDWDSHSAWSGTQFVVPVSGKYRISGAIQFASSTYAVGNAANIVAYQNTVAKSYGQILNIQAIVTQVIGTSISTTLNCVAGDLIELRAVNTRTAGATLLDTGAGENHIEIERIGN